MKFYRMVRFNYSRLFKHWSTYVLYGMVIAIIAGIGIAPRIMGHESATFTLYTEPSSYNPIHEEADILNKQVYHYPRYKVEVTQSDTERSLAQESAIVSVLPTQSDVIIRLKYKDQDSRNTLLENELKGVFENRLIHSDGAAYPQVLVEDQYIESSSGINMIVKIVVIFVPYIFALLFGTMIFIAVSVESIDKIMYLLLSKVSVYSIIYSKIVAVTAFFINLLILAAIGVFVLQECGLIHIDAFLDQSGLTVPFLLKYLSILVLGILQIIMLFTIFGLFIEESSQLQTGMMIPGIITAIGWGIGYWLLIFHASLPHNILAIIQVIPVVNVFTTIAHLGNSSLSSFYFGIFLVMTVLSLWGAHVTIKKIFISTKKINL